MGSTHHIPLPSPLRTTTAMTRQQRRGMTWQGPPTRTTQPSRWQQPWPPRTVTMPTPMHVITRAGENQTHQTWAQVWDGFWVGDCYEDEGTGAPVFASVGTVNYCICSTAINIVFFCFYIEGFPISGKWNCDNEGGFFLFLYSHSARS